MLFASTEKWWGDKGKRKIPHEGLDLCFFVDRQKKILSLRKGIKIPVMNHGTIVKIMNDYLGKSIVIEHGLENSDHKTFITIYGHTIPNKHLCIGEKVASGDCIATLADTRESLSGLPSHLHISAGWLSKELSYDQLDWNMIGGSKLLTLIDPVDLINFPYPILENR